MRRTIFLYIGLILALVPATILRAESRVKTTSPRVMFKSFGIQTEIAQGQFVQASAFFQLTAPIDVNEKVFFHLIPEGSNRPAVNIDFFPDYPTSRWVVGQVVQAGPADIVIPPSIEPGEYRVRLGLMEIVNSEEGTIYEREPYINSDISDFIVGKVTITEPLREQEEEEPQEKPTELRIVSFEKDEDIRLWEPVGAEVSAAAIGEIPAARVRLLPDSRVPYPGVELSNFFGIFPEYADWAEYDVLQFVLGAGAGESGRVLVQVNDQAGRQYKREFNLSGNAPQDIKLDMIEMGGVLDISDIARIKFFSTRGKKEQVFLIGNLRLLARGIADESPSVTFVKLQAPASIKRGEVFFVTPSFLLEQPVFAPCQLFVHVYKENTNEGRISATSSLPIPIRNWPLKEEISVASAPLMIRPDSPPGTYVIRAGLFTTIESSGEGYVKFAAWDDREGETVLNITQPVEGIDYIKQPYTNPEIRDWEIGKITVE